MKRAFYCVLSLVVLCALAAPASPQATNATKQTTVNSANFVQADSGAQKNPDGKVQGNPDVKVWVNTKSGVYHCPGTRWYGATKQGEYMTQAEAQKKGYRPAYGKFCQ
jgi:hypothetical protein